MKSVFQFLLLFFCLGNAWIAWPASAHYSCDVDLNYGVVVDHQQLRVVLDYHTKYQINQQRQLFVGGQWLKLGDQQAELVHEYAKGLHAVIPQVTLLATAGIDLAADTIQQMYLTLVGSDHDSYEKLDAAIVRIKDRVRKKFRYARTYYYLGASTNDTLDEFEDADLSLPLSTKLTTSLGSILTTLGTMDSDKLAVDRAEMAMINQRLAHYAANSDTEGPPLGSSLPEKARWYCSYFEKLDALEQKLQDGIPQLSGLDLIKRTSHKD